MIASVSVQVKVKQTSLCSSDSLFGFWSLGVDISMNQSISRWNIHAIHKSIGLHLISTDAKYVLSKVLHTVS